MMVSAGFLLLDNEVTVPGSTANLGGGFDTLGVAVQLYLRARIVDVRQDGGARLEVVSSRPAPRGINAVERAFAVVAKHANRSVPTVFAEVDSDIPLAAGLGSSAAATVAGLRIFDTDRTKAENLAELLGARNRAVVADSVQAAAKGAAGLVNATPVGMLPSRDSPVPEMLLHGGLWVADAVYYPLWTPLLIAAKAKGARVMTGRELAIHQAADAFELFTGLKPSTVEMGKAFDRVISEARAE